VLLPDSAPVRSARNRRGRPLAVQYDPAGSPALAYRDSVLITDLKEIRTLPRLMACLEESRGHRRYG
jgi:hypothetical protein